MTVAENTRLILVLTCHKPVAVEIELQTNTQLDAAVCGVITLYCAIFIRDTDRCRIDIFIDTRDTRYTRRTYRLRNSGGCSHIYAQQPAPSAYAQLHTQCDRTGGIVRLDSYLPAGAQKAP